MFQKCLVKKDLRATPKLATNLRNRQYHFEAYRSTVSCWRPESGRGQGRVRRGRPRRGMRRRYDLGATLGGDEDQQRLRRRHRHLRRRRRLRRRLRCLRLRATLVLALALAPDEQLAKDTKPLSATCRSFLSCTSHAPFRPLCMASQILTSLGIPTTLPCRCAAPHALPAPWRRRRSSFSSTCGRGSGSRTTVALTPRDTRAFHPTTARGAPMAVRVRGHPRHRCACSKRKSGCAWRGSCRGSPRNLVYRLGETLNQARRGQLEEVEPSRARICQ